jgi:uncharacterized protein (DUF885 family)
MIRLVAIICLLAAGPLCVGQDLPALSRDFWTWRAAVQPFTADDIPRLERPNDLRVDWSPDAIARSRSQWSAFETRFKQLAPSRTSVAEQVDYRLLGSALARVHWELDIDRRWQRDPTFYVDQTLGSFYLLLLPPPPFEVPREASLVSRLQSFPATLKAARGNLTDVRRPFAELAIDALADLPDRFHAMLTALAPQLDPPTRTAIEQAAPPALAALESYRQWLQNIEPSARQEIAIGRANYIFFLRQVALMPFSPEQLLAMAKQELDRTIAFAAYERARDGNLPPMPLFPSIAAQMAREQHDELQIRSYLETHHILTVPASVKHYHNLPLPAYVKPFRDLGVTDHLEDGVSYIQTPNPNAGFFALSTARDPRPIILHEGVPGHAFQLALGQANPDPIRRHYYDSGPNEGIGFYAEEMMLRAGLFDNSPGTRQIIYEFMRLRALRVEVDVRLALGEFTLSQAVDYLAKTVPMDHTTAVSEAELFASTPGQAISYQIGKLQIMDLLSRASRRQGSKFSLQDFHDFIWRNGNVPFSLQRWELLGDASDVPELSLP